MDGPAERPLRAQHDAHSLRVYQAYGDAIADAALAQGRFVSPPFKMDRMSWVKPSFLWMMYRSGWGLKDAGQSRILAIDITHEGFAWALAHSCPSHPEDSMTPEAWQALKAQSPVRIQWDPERDLQLRPLPQRTIQVGLSGAALAHYVNDWTVAITDVTPLAHRIHALVQAQEWTQAEAALPPERPYALKTANGPKNTAPSASRDGSSEAEGKRPR